MPAIMEQLDLATAPTVTDLSSIPLFRGLSASELNVLADRMRAVELEPGEILFRAGDPAEYLVVIIEGEIRAEKPDGTPYAYRRAGQTAGLLPFSRAVKLASTAKSCSKTRVLILSKADFADTVCRIPLLMERLVHEMADRIREFTRDEQHREKLQSLGRLSSNLAHELNNPASAAFQAAQEMKRTLTELGQVNERLLHANSVLDVQPRPDDWKPSTCPRLALETQQQKLNKSREEEQIAEWLTRRFIDNAWRLAPALVEMGFDQGVLEELELKVPCECLGDFLTRETAFPRLVTLANQIERCTERLFALVRATKSYSYMDECPQQYLDLHEGLESTLSMLDCQLQNVVLIRRFDRGLPRISAHGSELNQVWTNLIVNSLEAMRGKGRLTIETSRSGNWAKIVFTDDGPGIPKEIQHRIFEPFFSTKAPGLGLGLETVSRIVHHHGGDVRFASQPGETTFVVTLPLI